MTARVLRTIIIATCEKCKKEKTMTLLEREVFTNKGDIARAYERHGWKSIKNTSVCTDSRCLKKMGLTF